MSQSEVPETEEAQRADRRIRAVRGGSTQATVSAPKFSQPVRQVVLMLIVLALVVAGGWYAYGRIISIFSANPVLNAVIIGVFVLGVLTCFWQVAQLVRSVSWIERFAQRRRNASESGIAADGAGAEEAPRLLAPLASLLGARGPLGGVISTGSSRSILDSVATRIDEQRDITRYMSNLLIFLGLLGTFYGLAITVPAVVDTIRSLSPQEGESGLEVFDKLMEGLEGQLGGMGTAFSSSLLGLAGSLVIGLLELFAGHGQNRFYRELEEWMSTFTRIDIGAQGDGGDSSIIAAVLDQFSGQMADLQAAFFARDEERQREIGAAEARLRELAENMGGLAAQVSASLNAGHERATESNLILQRIADGQQGLAAHLSAAPQSQSDALLLRLVEGQDRMAALAERSVPAAAVAPASTPEQDESDLIEARMHLRSLDYQLARLVEEMAAGRADMVADLRDDIAALTRAIRQLERGDEA